jgi:hypothetical protein
LSTLQHAWREHRSGVAAAVGNTGSFANLERLLGRWRPAERRPYNDVLPVSSKLEPVRDPDIGHQVLAAALCIKPQGLLTDWQLVCLV